MHEQLEFEQEDLGRLCGMQMGNPSPPTSYDVTKAETGSDLLQIG